MGNFVQLGLKGIGPEEPPDAHARRVAAGHSGPFPLTSLQKQLLLMLLFHQGADKAIGIRDVMDKLRKWYRRSSTERAIKDAVRSLVVDFKVRIAAPRVGKTGYYLVTNSAEAKAAARPYIAEGVKLFQRARVLLDPHDMAELDGQIRLMLNGSPEPKPPGGNGSDGEQAA